MEAKIKELLEAAGIRPESALERFMGNEGIYQKFAWKFLDDKNYGALLKAVEEGDAVGAGDVLGAVGETAIAESALASHLHFAMTDGGEPVDPLDYLDQSVAAVMGGAEPQ